MRKIIYIFLALFLVSCGSDKTSSISTDTGSEISSSKMTVHSILSNIDKGSYKEGELLVKFKSGVISTASLGTHEAAGASVKRRFTLVKNLEHVKLPAGMSVGDAIKQYMSDPNVEYAEPNYLRQVTTTIPNDTYFDQQWGLMNMGNFAGGTLGADINATGAWDIRNSSSSIIAVLDTGVDYNHADLVGNTWINTGEISCADGIDNDSNGFIDDCNGWDFVNADNAPLDDNGHGTHVAGVAGAVGNNGAGVSGVLWNVNIMPLKFLDSTGSGTVANEILGIQYAIANGASIINASFGGTGFSSAESNAITSANNAGVLIIAAAGNGGGALCNNLIGSNNDLTPCYPASYSHTNIIAVAATDQNDRRAPFSNYGLVTVDVAAPGVYILSTIIQGSLFSLCTGSPFAGLDFCDGTSIAAPHVSALAELLFSYYTHFSHLQIRSTILRYVDILPELDGWILTGGRINAYLALSSLLTPTNLTATGASSSNISLSWIDNATGEDGYKIERMVAGGGGFVQIADIGSDSTTYSDSGLNPSTTYSYRVRAYNNIGDSFYSNVVSAIARARRSGGGNCSIAATKPNTITAMSDIALMLVPLVFITFMRLKRKYRN